ILASHLHEQRHHGLLGHALPAAHLQPLPPIAGSRPAPLHAPALPVLGDRR
uniref:Uncharacterized protein n=1 Tax=Capra hircus TaxID=9925 RepID=A0A8C2NFM9_CAPHI